MSSTPKTPSYDPTGYSDYAAQLMDDYNQEQELLAELNQNQISITQYQNDIKQQGSAGYWKTEIVGGTYTMHDTKVWVSTGSQTQINNDNAAINALVAEDEAIGAQIKVLDPLIGDSIDNLINAIKSETAQLTSGDQIIGGGPKQDLTDDMATMEQTVKALFSYVLDKIQADYYQRLIEAEGPDHFDSSVFGKLMSLENEMQQTISNLEDGLQNGFYDSNGNLIANGVLQYTLDMNDASGDEDGKSNFFWELKHFGTDPTKEIERDDQKIDNDNEMLGFIQNIAGLIGPEASSLDPNVTGSLILIDLAVKKIFELIGQGPITASEKQQVLTVLYEVLGYLQQLLAAVSQQKGKDDQEIEKDAKFNAEIQQSDILLQQKKADDAKEIADVSAIFTKVATGVMTMIAMAVAPGIGSMFMAFAMGLASESGILDKGAKALGDAVGSQIAGEAIMGAVAAVGGGGIGLAGDVAAAKIALKWAVEVAVEVATTAVTVIEEATETAVSATVGEGIEAAAARAAASTVLKQGIETAVKTAEQQVIKQFLSQNIMGMIKTGAAGLRQAILDATKEAAETAATELAPAAEAAASEATSIATVALENGASDAEAFAAGVALATPAHVLEDATEVGLAAGFKAAGVKLPGLFALIADSRAVQFAARAVAADLYSMASTNFFVDTFNSRTDIDKDSKKYQILLALISVVQGLIQAVSMSGGSGLLSSTGSKMADITLMMNIANFIQAMAMVTQGAASGLDAEANFIQADALENISNDTARLNAFQSMMDRVLQGTKAHNQKDQTEQKQEIESTNTMALHMFDAEKVLADMLGHSVV